MQSERPRFTRPDDDAAWTVLGLTPFEAPDARLAIAFARAGGLAILDLGRDAAIADAALKSVANRASQFGIRILNRAEFSVDRELPKNVSVIVVDARDARACAFAIASGRVVLVEVTSLDEATVATSMGAHGIIAKGSEAGGYVGGETSFVLLQHLVGKIALPIWVRGGIGIHTAAACIAAGARGVVLDSQLALLAESSLSSSVREALRAMDGSETTQLSNHRVYARPGIFSLPSDMPQDEVAKHFGVADLSRELLAVGQDGAFARPFSEKFRTVRGAVRGIHAGISAHLRQAQNLHPLAANSKFAKNHRLEFPIAQGPMTRVSDRAAFADAVSAAGALPFIALSLMRHAEARALLEETKTLLAGRTWGVGILGFLPPDIRKEQIDLLTEIKPPVALIAGGRPSQAQPLEDLGITTYLHVPSPGLLDLFFKDGARKFVFEGHECGGHVGPRSSFILWESCVSRLLEEDDLAGVSVLFAGGIHDGISAAMVSAIASPLAARGANVGVLMGTAYLFTREAVESGAIGNAFQEEAARCEKTVLLETAPGHATRCAASDYAQAFEEERTRLESAKIDPRERWEALEQLNLGRLRVASKGLARDGENLVPVSEQAQHADGMFMIGQVAALRSQTVTMRELHEDVAIGGSKKIAALEIRAPLASDETSVDVAIVGIASIFPGAADTAAFWKNIVYGENAVTEAPDDRWNKDLYFDKSGTGDKTPSKWGGFLPDTIFEPSSFGIPPRSLAAIDPAQLLSLEVARRALSDAGYLDRDFDRERASVIFGAESGTDLANAYAFRSTYRQYLGELPDALDDVLPKLTEDSFPGVLSNVIAGRIANRLDLGGVNYTVDAACASSLAAVDLGCKELAAGTSDLVISGGADLHNSINDYLLFASVHALSATGKCRTFDAKADGIALGEGVAAVVLKRLEDAVRDGDRVYAVIKGVGGSSDGKNLGLTAPRKEGQIRALERAYERAGISPADVSLVEAHGTGTVVGDKTELATLNEFFDEAGAAHHACTLGSVKSQIGHTKCAAGLAGLIKSALAIHHRVLPPTCNIDAPNAAYRAETSPFAFRKTASPWVEEKRRAGVSAFGFGGTNFHVVLESADFKGDRGAHGLGEWPSELFILRAKTHAELAETIALAQARIAEKQTSLRDLAATLNTIDTNAPVHAAIVASSLQELSEQLAAFSKGRDHANVFKQDHTVAYGSGEVAFVFPGQGSQRPNMLADLFVAFPFLQAKADLAKSLLPVIFPPSAFTPQEAAAQRAAITDTRVAQPALGMADLAMYALLQRVGVKPAMAAGHSYGELVALTVAGVFSESDLIAISTARANAILDAAGGEPGTMASVRAPAFEVAKIVDGIDGVVVANNNAPDQTIIAGSENAVRLASDALRANHAVRSIPVACAFHSPIVAPASVALAEALPIANRPQIPVYSNTTATLYPQDDAAIRTLVASQLAEPVRFADEIEAMYEAGARVFVEVGPGGVLTDLIGRILGERPHLAVACDNSSIKGITAFLIALAKLAVAGVPVDTKPLFEGRDAKAIAIDVARAPSSTAWVVNGQTARPLHGELPEHAMKIVKEPLVIETATATRNEREEAVVEYLKNMRELVDGQRQVMLRYLGEVAPAVLREDAPITKPPTKPAVTKKINDRKSATKQAHSEITQPSVVEQKSPLETLVAVVAQRTGYPTDMLDLDLDLEADLGIDSIKRIEILGLVSEKLGMKLVASGTRSQIIEELATVKTLRGIALWLDGRISGAPATIKEVAVPAAGGMAPSIESAPVSTRGPVERYVVEVRQVEHAKPNCVTVAGKMFAIVPDDRGVAEALSEMLKARGAETKILDEGDALGRVDGMVYLGTLGSNSADALKQLFSRAKDAIAADAKWIVATTGLGGDFGRRGRGVPASVVNGGVNGLMKSLLKEQPDVRVHAIDLDRDAAPQVLAEQIFAELLADDRRTEVGYHAGDRLALEVISNAVTPKVAPIDLDSSAVVLVTGGARGITAQIAIALARKFKCSFELVGRSAMSEMLEDAEIANAREITALRPILIARANGAGLTTPAAIDSAAREILATREIRATLDAIREAGGAARYHALDVRDEAKLGALIDTIYAERGRIDGVIHGAGLIEDKLIHHKTRESFDRVYDTKVGSALTLVHKLRHDVRFISFFSSVSGAFGNRGQTDYAAANATLDALAHNLRATRNTRVLSVNWGPWAGAGMVRPELEAEYGRRGVALISPEDGAERFIHELCHGDDAQVILSAASPKVLES
jgi:acyl transferase domain-containing protein/NAD(P)H-dependent flavin oxidoreductase YrpB (nitropropane dioxygenase family)/NAD(P)-dependent dehydrogenase (short-subunit alcohol dehydrogenase family)